MIKMWLKQDDPWLQGSSRTAQRWDMRFKIIRPLPYIKISINFIYLLNFVFSIKSDTNFSDSTNSWQPDVTDVTVVTDVTNVTDVTDVTDVTVVTVVTDVTDVTVVTDWCHWYPWGGFIGN